jgi:hypothetical protein
MTLVEVFSFATASQIEFLNTIASILDSSITELLDPEADITTSCQEPLMHCQGILEWHVHKVSEIADMLKSRDLLSWPTSHYETAVKSTLFLQETLTMSCSIAGHYGRRVNASLPLSPTTPTLPWLGEALNKGIESFKPPCLLLFTYPFPSLVLCLG